MYIPIISDPAVVDISSTSSRLSFFLRAAVSSFSWLASSTALYLTRLSSPESSLVAPILSASSHNNYTILILGGGVAGIHAAQTLHEEGISDFMIVEARGELGGRMKSFTFGAPGREFVLEAGANWIHGTQTGDGPVNPIFELAQKHNLSTQTSRYFDSMSKLMKTYLRTRADPETQRLMTILAR